MWFKEVWVDVHNDERSVQTKSQRYEQSADILMHSDQILSMQPDSRRINRVMETEWKIATKDLVLKRMLHLNC